MTGREDVAGAVGGAVTGAVGSAGVSGGKDDGGRAGAAEGGRGGERGAREGVTKGAAPAASAAAAMGDRVEGDTEEGKEGETGVAPSASGEWTALAGVGRTLRCPPAWDRPTRRKRADNVQCAYSDAFSFQ